MLCKTALACACDGCDSLRSIWSSSNLDASERNFFTVWPPNASWRNLVSVLLSSVPASVHGPPNCCCCCCFYFFCNLRLICVYLPVRVACLCKFAFPYCGRECTGARARPHWIIVVFCNADLRRICVYLPVRVPTHRKSVSASSHFHTCVYLRLRLAGALWWFFLVFLSMDKS